MRVAFPQTAPSGPAVSSAAPQKQSGIQARAELDRGVQAFKAARYGEAAECFKKAVTLDPTLLVARLYLGTTYMQLWDPASDAPENKRYGELAIQEFSILLKNRDLSKETKLHALKSIASIQYNRKEFDDSISYYRQSLEADRDDPEVYYMIGVIEWAQAYQAAAENKAKIGLSVDDPYSKTEEHQRNCREQQRLNMARVTDGIAVLDRAIALRPDYEDAMAYMNLLYRRKGDLECGDSRARAADIKMADEWSDKTMATREGKMKKE